MDIQRGGEFLCSALAARFSTGDLVGVGTWCRGGGDRSGDLLLAVLVCLRYAAVERSDVGLARRGGYREVTDEGACDAERHVSAVGGENRWLENR